MNVKEAMHKGVAWMPPNTPVEKLARKMQDLDIGAIPIGEDDKLIGMVTDRDIVIKGLTNGADISGMTARDVMTRGIIYCRDSEDLGDALRIMEDKKIRRLPVINEHKRMVGMLSLGDVSHAASREMTGELTAAVSEHHTA
ncbi:MAG: CBS domain-containing protein [Pseudomonadota bacterium]